MSYGVTIIASVAMVAVASAFGYLINRIRNASMRINCRTRELKDTSIKLEKEIKERKMVEKRLGIISGEWRMTFDSTQDVMVMLNARLDVIRANAASIILFERGFHAMIGAPVSELFSHIQLPVDMEALKKVYDTKNREARVIFYPGKNRWLDVSVDPILDSSGNVSGSVLVIRDITDIKTMQEQLLHVQKMDSIGRLAGGVAHDFNNILSVVIGYSELALKELPEGSIIHDHISAIRGAGEKAAALTKKLLAFSRKQVLDMKAVNMTRVIGNMTKMLERLIPENITLIFEAGTGDQQVLADPVQMEQILMNLVVNARDAMSEGGYLTISTAGVVFDEDQASDKANPAPGGYLRLSVKDTGIGMSREVQDKIFEPFFSTKKVGEGTGMGLATVYGIVKQHNGHIDVLSEQGKGSTFSIYFPVTAGETEEIAGTKAEGAVTGKETILVVDDEPLLRDIIAGMLAPLGYEVFEAGCAEEALKISEEYAGSIDLLLTDVIMPGMNGKKLADIMIKRYPGIKVIFMSGYTDDVIARHGVLDEGIVLIQKPVAEKVLTGRIREVLDSDNQRKPACAGLESPREISVLLVDDNKDIRRLIKAFLKDCSCRIDTAENGEIAVRKCVMREYDLILMDMQMPVMDGPSAIRDIRKREREKGLRQATVIALTGNADPEDISVCLKAGASFYLEKPVSKDVLVKAVFSCEAPEHHHADRDKKEGSEKMVATIEEELKDLIPEYMEERQNDINRMLKALETQDYEAVRILGHTLKGSGGGYGFGPITDIGLQIEEAARQGNRKDVGRWINELSYYIDNVEVLYRKTSGP
ncbi:MAG: response regulator [Nitrospiraceae bacterium]|nr:MAG: response regulator [Nitrospiraceae bacterium]